MYALVNEQELYHHGILGMKWGIRRFQKYGEGGYNPKHKGKYTGENKTESDEDKARKDKIKKAAVIGAAVAGTALAAYGGYKVAKFVKMDKAKWEFARQLVDDFNYDKKMSTRIGAAPPNSGIAFSYRLDQSQKLGNLGLTKSAMKNFSDTHNNAKNVKEIRDSLDAYNNERKTRLSKQLQYFRDETKSSNVVKDIAKSTSKNISNANQIKPSVTKTAEQAFNNADLQKKLDELTRQANVANSAASNAQSGRDFVEELLKKNKKKLN